MIGPARPTIDAVADVGNSRIKCAPLADGGAPDPAFFLPLDDPEGWATRLGPTRGRVWAIASVNPPAESRLIESIEAMGGTVATRLGSAADVPQANELEAPSATGVDRALAVLAARELKGGRGPGIVILCGTAITVESLDESGVWLGGAIAPGAGPLLETLHGRTARLPLVRLEDLLGRPSSEPPEPLGRSTVPAMRAGAFWGLVGAVRELIARQAAALGARPWTIWTGGDAPGLASAVEGSTALVVPDLVLRGLAWVVRGPESSRS